MPFALHAWHAWAAIHANHARAAGLVYWIDIAMRFRMGFCVVYNLKRELIMDGGLIAHFYVRHNTFLLDFLSAMPSIAEVCLQGAAVPAVPMLPCDELSCSEAHPSTEMVTRLQRQCLCDTDTDSVLVPKRQLPLSSFMPSIAY